MQLDRALYEKVCKFLWREWDPIGVNHVEATRDEYDSYAAGIIRLVQSGADIAHLANHLGQIEHESMGLPGSNDVERLQSVAEKLIRLMRG